MSRKGNPPMVFERSASVEKSKWRQVCHIAKEDLEGLRLQCHALCMRFAPPPHELVTRTPALDDVHQTVDTLGMLLRRGRFVLAGSVFSNLFALHSVTHFSCALHLPSWACHQDPVKMKGLQTLDLYGRVRSIPTTLASSLFAGVVSNPIMLPRDRVVSEESLYMELLAAEHTRAPQEGSGDDNDG
ncbi:hypothetical protein B0H14DRAFT_2625519 [Mycena olivaceomarginata]|nr:hypothetical protein B0H14DRAFT_2625519 [Mycena olivaceomarginata]